MIKAAVMVGPKKPIELRDLPDPAVPEGAILLETIASEVCGTDVHLHHGRLAGVPYPIIPGHVSVGRILEKPGVERDALGAPLAVGDVVTFYDVHETCGRCYHCAVTHQPNRCPSRKVYGITYSVDDGPHGGWAERILLRPGMLTLKLPDGLDADTVIGGGCGLFTGFAAVERADIAMGDTVVVQGVGPVGLAATAFARLRGASAVLSIGAPDTRCALALRLGADEAVDISTAGPRAREDRVKELTHGRGADVVIEATGNPDAVAEGFRMLRDGGTYVIAGHYTDRGPVSVNPHLDLNRKHADVRGLWGTDFSHVVRALQLLARHRDRLPFADVIGGRYGLAEAGRALADVEALRVTKAVVTP